MKFAPVAELFSSLGKTSKRLEKQLLLRDFFLNHRDEAPLLADIIAGNYQRQIHKKEIGISTKTIFAVLSVASQDKERDIEKKFNELGDVGLLSAHFLKDTKQQSLAQDELSLHHITSTLERIAKTTGKNSNKIKVERLSHLFLQASSETEYIYLARMLVDDLRIGVSEGVLKEACVHTYLPSILGYHLICGSCGYANLMMNSCFQCGEPLLEKQQKTLAEKHYTLHEIELEEKTEEADIFREETSKREDLNSLLRLSPDKEMVNSSHPREIYNTLLHLFEKKYNLLNSFRLLLEELTQDPTTLLQAQIQFGRPLRSMLGTSTATLQGALEVSHLPALLDFKYDGLRLQVHNHYGCVRLFSRNLDEITPQFPELVEHIATNFSDTAFVMDCEGVGYDREKHQYLPFQILSRRILTKNVSEVSHITVVLKAFDLLAYEEKTLIDTPFKKRRDLLEEIFLHRRLRQPLYKNNKS